MLIHYVLTSGSIRDTYVMWRDSSFIIPARPALGLPLTL